MYCFSWLKHFFVKFYVLILYYAQSHGKLFVCRIFKINYALILYMQKKIISNDKNHFAHLNIANINLIFFSQIIKFISKQIQ